MKRYPTLYSPLFYHAIYHCGYSIGFSVYLILSDYFQLYDYEEVIYSEDFADESSENS